MPTEQVNLPNREDRLEAALVACLEAIDNGPPVDRAALLARYPEFAVELAKFMEDQASVDRRAAPLRWVAVGRTPSEIEGDRLQRHFSCPAELGDFRLIREVGKGGMGVVYEAEQVSLRRRVALKVLPFAATMDPRHLQRFHNEAQAAACLHHTSIVPVYFVGVERGVHFYAMQFIDGQPLSELIHQLRQAEKKTPASREERRTAYQGSPDDRVTATPTVRAAGQSTPLTSEGKRGQDYFRKVAELGVQAAEALDHAHQLGIVHRDIKPGNLLLDGRGNLWVTDFGLAHVRQSEANLTVTGQLVGTPRYMSPEQALTQRVPIDHRTDVYSLGATLYELLTLRPAFESEDRQELLRQIAFEEPARPRRLERAIPAELEIIVLKAMEKRPQDRYATAEELADDLERWLKNEPIRARRPTLFQRSAKWGRRHKPVVAAGSVVLLMALGMAGYIAWTRHDRAMQREGIELVVKAALEDTDTWQRQRLLPEALSAARRANGLLAGADVDDGLRQRARARLANLELLDKLENVRLEKMTQTKDGYFDLNGADGLYGQTFRDAGLDVEALPLEEAGERIRMSTVAAELAAVLDHWASIRQKIRGADDPSWKDFLRVARLVDPDAWRTRVRDALERWDRQALREMAVSKEVILLSPATLVVVGSALAENKEVSAQAEGFLREAQRQHPNDFWLNYNLFAFFRTMQAPQLEDAIRFAAVAVALRPASPGAHLNLGYALDAKGLLDEAIAEFREAIRLKTDFAGPHLNLGNALKKKGGLDEAIAEYREAIRLEPDSAGIHNNLGIALAEKGQLNEAIVEFRESVRLNADSAENHNNLGTALRDKGQLDEAIAEYREAIRLKGNYVIAHINLAAILGHKGDVEGAIAECREAIRLDRNHAGAHNGLGAALQRKGDLDGAIAEYREAIRLNKDYAGAHSNLGHAFRAKGQFTDALAHYRRGYELEKGSRWRSRSNQWVKECERLAELDGKLPRILIGEMVPSDAAECLELAAISCTPAKQLYAAAVRFCANAFAKQTTLADDLNAQHRYNAACAAALAGCGQGMDAGKLDAKERSRLRKQALDWLRADLKAWSQILDKSPDKARPVIVQQMQHWLADEDFAGVRGEAALGKLPVEERKGWQKLWQEVETLRKRAAERPAAANPARPPDKQ